MADERQHVGGDPRIVVVTVARREGREHLALNTEDAVQRALDKRKGGAGRGDLGVDVHAVHRGRDSQTSVPAVAENDDEDKSAS